MQSASVDLFYSRGLAIAPLPSSLASSQQSRHFALAGIIGFTAPKANGSLSLSWTDDVFSLFKPPVAPNSHAAQDLLRELANQLIGRVKNRLMHFQIFLKIGVPAVVSGRALDRQRQRREMEVVYLFRTLRGEIVVTLDVTIDPGALSYSTGVTVAQEGEFIVF